MFVISLCISIVSKAYLTTERNNEIFKEKNANIFSHKHDIYLKHYNLQYTILKKKQLILLSEIKVEIISFSKDLDFF